MANQKKTNQGKVPALKPVAATGKPGKPASGKPGAGKPATAADRRAKVAAAQKAQARWQQTKRLLIVLAVVVALTIVSVLVAVIANNARQARNKAQTTGAPTAQITPSNATADGSAIIANPSVTNAALTLNIYFDYQCPVCKTVEEAIGPSAEKLAASGDISLQYNLNTFLDANLSNTSSTRSAIAATCADTISPTAFQAYHNAAFAAQAAEKVGVEGYSDEQLRTTFAAAAGITGDDLTKFRACYDTRATSDFVTKANQVNGAALKAKYPDPKTGNGGTPTFAVNGKKLDLTKITATMATNADELLALLKTTAGVS